MNKDISAVLRQGWKTAFLLAATSSMAAASTLTVYTWADYIDPAVVSEFEQRFDSTVRFSYFDSDEARDLELAANEGEGYDVLMVNRLQLPRYVRRGWLAPLGAQQVPNRRNVEQQWSEDLDTAADYALPYFWGTMGIAYRRDLIPDGFDSWKDLLTPDDHLYQKLVMPNFSRELVSIALKAQGHSANAHEPEHIDAAGRLLISQKPRVRYYGYPALDRTSDLVTGAVWAAAMYSGDVLMLQEHNADISYVIPEEGALLWVDYLSVSSTSDNKQLAYEFINFLNEPEIAARQAEYVYYATPNEAARKFLSDEFLTHPLIYPSSDVMRRSEFLAPLPPRSQKRVNVIGSKLYF